MLRSYLVKDDQILPLRQDAIPFFYTGGGERDRTDDLLRAKQALSQLSYTPILVVRS